MRRFTRPGHRPRLRLSGFGNRKLEQQGFQALRTALQPPRCSYDPRSGWAVRFAGHPRWVTVPYLKLRLLRVLLYSPETVYVDSGHEGFIAAVLRWGGVRIRGSPTRHAEKRWWGLPAAVFDGLCGRLASGQHFREQQGVPARRPTP